MKLDPNAPAYPVHGEHGSWPGLTVREAFAKHMMGNILVGIANPNMQFCARLAVEAADALIAELNKEPA